jgi:hypothetical protein
MLWRAGGRPRTAVLQIVGVSLQVDESVDQEYGKAMVGVRRKKWGCLLGRGRITFYSSLCVTRYVDANKARAIRDVIE